MFDLDIGSDEEAFQDASSDLNMEKSHKIRVNKAILVAEEDVPTWDPQNMPIESLVKHVKTVEQLKDEMDDGFFNLMESTPVFYNEHKEGVKKARKILSEFITSALTYIKSEADKERAAAEASAAAAVDDQDRIRRVAIAVKTTRVQA